MKTLTLIGKEYDDTISIIERNNLGETNECLSLVEKRGGIYNFKEVDFGSLWRIMCVSSGKKRVHIVSDKSNSTRTSYVFTEKQSNLTPEDIKVISKKTDWVHISYVDDFESFGELVNLSKPYSLDFCSTQNRLQYLKVMNKASVLFDSRERKSLYDGLDVKTELILHDENGIEIIKDGKVIYEEENVPLKDLNVNGAGDIFAGYFIKNYYSLGLFESSKRAMKETTKLLSKRI